MRKRDELTDPRSCMSRAREDEWTFVLLGRDRAAPATIRFWIEERIRLGKNQRTDPQIVEAEAWIAEVAKEQGGGVTMRRFEMRELREAIDHAASGGQALHVHTIIANRQKAPTVFKRAVDRGEEIGHLFDMDRSRLEQTARSLGVRVIRVERIGTAKQHIDLVAGPLRKALAMCAKE